MTQPEQPVRLLSTDLDGTIVFDGRVSDADVAAMRRWRDAGGLLVMNTGRSNTALASALDGFDVEYDYAVLYTGAVILDGAGQVLRARTLPLPVVREVVEEMSRHDPITVFVTTLAGDLQVYDAIGSGTELLTLFTRGSLADLAGRDVVGVPLHVSSVQAGIDLQSLVRDRWGGIVDGARNQDFLDLIPHGATKGAGLTDLVRLLTGPGGCFEGRPIETYTLGDSWNDLPMHAVADHPVAMARSAPEVTRACERSTPSLAALVDEVLSGEVASAQPGEEHSEER